MKKAGIALMGLSILLMLVVCSWVGQAATERLETDPIGGQLDIGIACFFWSFLALALFLAGSGLVAAGVLPDRWRRQAGLQ